VWQTERTPGFAAANYRQSTETTCGLGSAREIVSSLSLAQAMVGGGLFNMNGELLAVILPCDDHIAAIDAASIDDILARAGALEQRLLARYGVLFAPLSEHELRHFKDSRGLFVREVWIDSPAGIGGLWPGDLVTALNRQPAVTLEDLRALTEASVDSFELSVQRGASTLTLRVPRSVDGVGSAEAEDAGLSFASAARTLRVDSVLPGSPAAQAGIRPGDRLVRINRNESRNPEQVARALADRRTPVLLEIERDERRIAIVIP
jgi:S1-C subfamily serine protease